MSKDQNVVGLLVSKELRNENKVHVNGMMRVKEDVIANEVNVNGMLKAFKNMEVNTIEVNGMMKVKGNIKSKHTTCNGYINTNDIETEECHVDGKIKCKVLNCDLFDLKLGANCHIKEIEASKVIIKKTKIRNFMLHSDVISADEIQIESVKCDYVTGDHVIIGPKCQIKKVDYKTSIEIHPSAKVNEQEKI